MPPDSKGFVIVRILKKNVLQHHKKIIIFNLIKKMYIVKYIRFKIELCVKKFCIFDVLNVIMIRI